MSALLVGYARCFTEEQDLSAQRDGLAKLGVDPERTYVDHGLTAATGSAPGCGKLWPLTGLATLWW